MVMTSGVLEHVLLGLYEKGIPFDVRVVGPREGLDTQIIVEVPDKDLFINIMKKETRVSYFLTEKGVKRGVSRSEVLTKIEKLKG